MKNLNRIVSAVIGSLIFSTAALAQRGGDGGAACAACGVFGVIYLLILAVALAIGIGIIILIFKFIKKDATARGMPNADSVKWLALLGLLGLIIYLIIRPSTPPMGGGGFPPQGGGGFPPQGGGNYPPPGNYPPR